MNQKGFFLKKHLCDFVHILIKTLKFEHLKLCHSNINFPVLLLTS